MKNIQKILLATDFSEASKSAEEMAIYLRDHLDATLTVVHAFDPSAFEMPAPYYFMPGADTWLNERLDDLRKKGAEALEEYCQKLGNCDCEFLEGRPGKLIVAYAKANDIDLTVLGTHGHTGLNRVLLGSVAEYVTRHMDKPVVTVKPPHKED
jgi:nucleotide-binding universal stress UspA family protein